MNFLNFINAAETVLNFKLNSQPTNPTHDLSDNLDHSAFKKISQSQPNPVSETKKQEEPQFDKIMEERQRLINQYLQLNIQILQKEIKQKDQNPKTAEHVSNVILESEQKGKEESHKKKIKKVNNCGHEDKQHYAKGMCSNCYHRYGRVKKPWRCAHDKLYAAGMCQNCYINDYNRKRREENQKIEEGKDENTMSKLIGFDMPESPLQEIVAQQQQ